MSACINQNPNSPQFNQLASEIRALEERLLVRQIRNGKISERFPGSVPKQAERSTLSKKVASTKTKGEPGPGPTKVDTAESKEVIDVSRLDFRVGRIVDVQVHPGADCLYLEKVDIGEPVPKTIVSGFFKHVSIAELENRLVVLLCNMKPAKMRGINSEAMIMCAVTPDKEELLIPPRGSVPGDMVDFEGFARNPDPVLSSKKKVFETVVLDLKTNGERVATYKGVPFQVLGKGLVTTATLANANVK